MKAPVRLATLLIMAAAWVALPAPASAAGPVRAVLADLESDAAEREVAGSLGLLLRSMLGPGQRVVVPARELALALEVASAGRRREVLIVGPPAAKSLMERLNADRLFIGSLKLDKTHWEVRGQILGPEGTRLSSVAAKVPPNDLHGLASQLAQRLAARLGLTVFERPPVTLSAMAPYARAQASLNAGDPNAAARTLETADPRPGATLNSAKEVVEALAANPNLPAPSRMQLSLLAGDNAGARHTADEILKVDPKNTQARAGKVRALANQGDVETALKEFEPIKNSKDPYAAVASAQLLIKRRSAPDRAALAQDNLSEDAQTEALATSMKDPASDNEKTLALIAATGPNALPPEVETAAVGAAERVALKDPALASSVATRALKGGVEVEKALPLAKIEKLDKSEVAAVKDKLEALGPKGETAMKALGQELEKREGQAEKLRLGGVELPAADSALGPLAGQLRALLGHFGVLQEQLGPRAMVVAKQDIDARWYKPFWVRRPRLEHGLQRAMWEKPYEMGLVTAPPDAEVVTPANLTEIHLGNLLERVGADLVVVHSEQPSGLDVEVELILFDGASGTAYRTRGKVAGMQQQPAVGERDPVRDPRPGHRAADRLFAPAAAGRRDHRQGGGRRYQRADVVHPDSGVREAAPGDRPEAVHRGDGQAGREEGLAVGHAGGGADDLRTDQTGALVRASLRHLPHRQDHPHRVG